jgi:molybdopterin molybdotransferase
MISVEKAIKAILKDIDVSDTEKVPLTGALGRVISRDETSSRNIPFFNNSAMDGYALRHADVKSASAVSPAILELIGESKAGTRFSKRVTKGAAVKIMTGAVMPDGADAVVKVEDVKEKDGFVYFNRPVSRLQYVRHSGEDIKEGGIVLKKGRRLKPADIGILSSLKRRTVTVYKRPTVAILCTGDELIEIDDNYEPGRVVSSNLYSLSAQVEEAGGIPVNLGIVKDDKKELLKKLKKGLKYDFLLTSGGISMGDYDYVKEALEEIGAENRIFKVYMRPGKPFSYFVCNNTRIFALPGNPVSCMVSFEIFVRPAIRKAVGIERIFNRKVDAVLQENIKKEKGYKFFVRGIIKNVKDGYSVKPTGPQGSGILRSMSLANGLIAADEGREILTKGETVKVIVIDDSFDNTKSF